MKLFVFRNATVEPFFPRAETEFSGYGDIPDIPSDAEKILWFQTLPPDTSPEETVALAEDFLRRLQIVLARIPAETPLELTELAAPENAPLVVADTRAADAVVRYNAELEKIASVRDNTKILPAPDFAVDWRLWLLAQMPFSPTKKRAPAQLPVVPATRKKCIVLDCDGTLWGGTLGDDGVHALKIGGDYPGNAFSFFQKKLVELAASGIILAVCSKNDDAPVREIFENHPAMILRPKHISVWRVNWRDKAENLRDIAAELNIGTDSIVFIDNDPRERARIEHAFGGEVATPAFPKKIWELPAFFEKLADEFFRAEKITAEDSDKTRQYRNAADRAEFSKKFASVENYIAALEIRLQAAPANDFSIPRLAQLTQKTNQFNLTTRRRTEEDLRNFIARGNAVFSLAAADKIGDLGIVGETEIEFNASKKIATVVNFMMSCRALGRGIETAFAQKILNALRERRVEKVFAEYFPTAKNTPCRDFWKTLGFVEENSDGTRFSFDFKTHDAFEISPALKFLSNE